MVTYLLDTNTVSELARNPSGRAAQMYRTRERDSGSRIVVSIMVACELRYGVEKKRAVRLAERVGQLLSSIEVVPLSAGADAAYAAVRCDLERRGQPIGGNDMLIAAHAIALDAILVTDNVREFRRVRGLRLENWVRGARSDPA